MNMKEINIYLSKLISNPKYSIKMYENPNKFMKINYISQENKDILVDFFRKNGDKFVKSSILQKNKRMEGLIMALPYLYKYLAKEQFEYEFEKYLLNLDFDNEVKKNPIIESIFFCRHIINKTKDNILKNIAIYEKEKNSLLIDLQQNNLLNPNTKENLKYNIDDIDLERLFIASNSTIRIKKFNIDIISVLSLIDKKLPKDAIKKTPNKNELNILFYKKQKSRKIISLSIGDIINHIIFLCKKVISFSELYQEINKLYNIDKECFITTLKNLRSNNLVSFNI
ncbi:hypothetical protein [Xenorhabdus eapokensis]|uniref:Uncharacterized protein n=1 Tax=Xenorhabdus eapokensis TaxID=1873482 RepID=A0A1Q5TYF3_9GAMM|nr:hypothetical protein [Xenorhabdus eapokensis]OKP04807.1 hypothetical protein Xedl_00706 [Xenorhabdus eapokensis]OKP05250.1 hypothetical protein Xedl_00474 [Xenorhabdus eapokensis]